MLTESIGWESIFYVNVPIGIAAICVDRSRGWPSRSDPNAGRIDWPGLVTFSGGLFLLVFALVRGNAEGWGSPLIVSFLVGAVVLLVAFVVVERASSTRCSTSRCSASRPSRGVHRGLRAVGVDVLDVPHLTLYIQNALGYSPLEAGVRFLPLSLLSFLVAPIAGRLSARVPIRALIGAACCSSASR